MPTLQVLVAEIAQPLDMNDLSPFVYDILSPREIRLLTPDASVSDLGLSWRITNANIDDLDQSFIALSYAWAARSYPATLSISFNRSHDATFPITCNGRQFWVHHNLYTALPFLARHIEVAKPLGAAYWIDAICINQEDDDERYLKIDS